MISVTDARKLIQDYGTSGKKELLSLIEANGSVLAETIYAPIDTPPFHQSSMDGYAFSFEEWDGHSSLLVVGEIQAGCLPDKILKPSEAFRIYTGASLPDGADTVVMQEKVIVENNSVKITDESIVKGANVRRKGSQTKKGEAVLKSEQLLTPAALSFLAGIGIDKVNVYSKPVVSIIITGNELINNGDDLVEAKVYESNSVGLTAALQHLNIVPSSVTFTGDNETEIINAVEDVRNSDIILLTGGVSVGNYDLVQSALEKCGTQKIFHRVRQKPGKPLYFGKLNDTLVFGLPGNPASSLTCFYEYVVPAMESFTHVNYLKRLKLPLLNDFSKKTGMTYFLKGRTQDNGVTILGNQESYLLNSFAIADCLIELEEDKEKYIAGELVSASMIV